jgi:ABC-type Mn2+/Zn2+ transport system ATPase subunit
MIEVKNISFAHHQHAIHTNFSAQLESGEAVLLTGPNGTGKSTLLALIGGLLTPQSGSIEIDGRDITTLSSKEQAALRAIAPQRRTFTLAYTVAQTLEFLPKKARIEDASIVIASLQLTELLQRKVTELSVGQQERVSLAIALTQRAKYYLLDEPFSAQDSASIEAILELISHIKKSAGVLVISHNQESIAHAFDREISLA